eukprot:scaffold1562_cov93-Skeletonema_dohrnii-CCMP3373.AAC.3
MPIERHQEGAAQADEFDAAMKNNTKATHQSSANNGIAGRLARVKMAPLGKAEIKVPVPTLVLIAEIAPRSHLLIYSDTQRQKPRSTRVPLCRDFIIISFHKTQVT